MKHLFNIRLALTAVALAFAGATFTACEEDIEITNNTTNPWGELDGIFGGVRSAAGAKMGTTLTLKNGKDATGHVYFELSKAAEQDTKVTFKIDQKALDEYNEANGTNYDMYQGVTLENNGITTIAAGKRKSEMLAVNIPAGQAQNTAAVAITATADNGTTVASNNASYVYLIKSIGNVKYDRDIKNIVYVEVNNESPLNAGEYMMGDHPFFDIVSIFAANINLDKDGAPYISCNEQTKYVLQNADKIIRPLQEKGIRVHLSILGNHDDAGMRSLTEEGARTFAKELKAYADIYGLDGFDFDDEYSSYAGDDAAEKYKGTSSAVVSSLTECTPENYTRFLQICREVMPKEEDGLTFGIYWYTETDHPKGDEVEDLIDYAVYGSYGRFQTYSGQDIAKELQAPYAITLVGEDNGAPAQVSINNSYLDEVKNTGYKYFAFYNLKAKRRYMTYFNKVANRLWNRNVTWTGKYFDRTDMTPKQSPAAPTYESYLGEWTATPSAGLYYYYDGDTPKWWDWTSAPAFDITIEEDVPGESYKVYGWDGKDFTKEHPFIMTYDEEGTTYCTTQTIGSDNGITYAMSQATYQSNPPLWLAVPPISELTFVLETSFDGSMVYMCGPGKRYGFNLFEEQGDTYSSVEDVRSPHSSGAYILVRK